MAPAPRPWRERIQFTPIMFTYTDLLPKLIDSKLLVTITLAPIQRDASGEFPRWYDPEARCDYHQGVVGHTTERCLDLKFLVQDLINKGLLKINAPSHPIVDTNPLPKHDETINATINQSTSMKKKVDDLRMPLSFIWKVLVGLGKIEVPVIKENGLEGPLCLYHQEDGHDIQDYPEFRSLIQESLDNYEIKAVGKPTPLYEGEVCVFDRETPSYCPGCPLVLSFPALSMESPKLVAPVLVLEAPMPTKPMLVLEPPTPTTLVLILEPPAPFPYSSDARIPRKYDVGITVVREKVVAITDPTHFTRSGRFYNNPPAERTKKKATTEEKGKVVVVDEVPVKRPVREEEAEEFLSFLKQSEYSIVDHLHKHLAKISILSLLMNSPSHRNALLSVLNSAYVSQDVMVEGLSRLINNIAMDNLILFSDDEIPSEGRGILKALNITAKCKGHILPDVLIDNGSVLNILPLSTLNRLTIDVTHMKKSHVMVRAFDGTTREALGKIEVPILIGPCIFEIEFYVMDIIPNYNCLLGRPWIHAVGAAPSSLHQRVKFIIEGKLVCVRGEEAIVGFVALDGPYLKPKGDAEAYSFSSLKVINALYVFEGSRPPVPSVKG